MNLKYACFISFRGDSGDIVDGFVSQIYKALNDKISISLGPNHVFMYKNSENASIEFLDKKLKSALDSSATMLLVAASDYFSKAHKDCVKECMYMLKLEKMRRTHYPEIGHRTQLIIPVCLSELPFVPDLLVRNDREWIRFVDFRLGTRTLSTNAKFQPLIDKVAANCVSHFNQLQGAIRRQSSRSSKKNSTQAPPWPTDAEAKKFLSKYRGAEHLPLPAREISRAQK